MRNTTAGRAVLTARDDARVPILTEVMMTLGWSLVAVPLLIGLNAFFVAAEYAVVALRDAQVASMRQRGWRATATAVERLRSNPASAIGTIQICITMTNLLLGWIGEPAMSAVLLRALGPLGEFVPEAVFRTGALALSFVIVTLLTVVFSELLPKALTLRYAEEAAVLTAVTVLGVRHALRPLVWLMTATANAITRPLGLGDVDDLEKQDVTLEELRLLAGRAGESGVLTPRERSLVLNSLAIAGRKAREIMVPRVRVRYLDVRKSMEENREVADEYLYSRLPLCDGTLDRVLGVVPTKEFLSAYHADGDAIVLSLIARPPVFVPELVALDRLLEEFRRNRTQLVFLVDEYGGVEGIVTLQDVVDELLGEIGEAPSPGVTAPTAAGATMAGRGESFVVAGEMPLRELATRLARPGWALRTAVATVGGLLSNTLKRIPREGEEVRVDGVRLRVVEGDGRAVRRVEVQVIGQ